MKSRKPVGTPVMQRFIRREILPAHNVNRAEPHIVRICRVTGAQPGKDADDLPIEAVGSGLLQRPDPFPLMTAAARHGAGLTKEDRLTLRQERRQRLRCAASSSPPGVQAQRHSAPHAPDHALTPLDFIPRRNSSGNSAVKVSRSPVRGWEKVSEYACSISRGTFAPFALP